MSLRQSIASRVLDRLAPPHVVVDAEGAVVHRSALADGYLEPEGRNLRVDLRGAIREAMAAAAPRERVTLSLGRDGHDPLVLSIDPLIDPEVDGPAEEPLFLVTFRDDGRRRAAGERVARLERDLRETRDRLKSMIEALAASRAELQVVNDALAHKIDALDRSNADLRNLFDSTQIATLFLDEALRIRSFSPPIAELFDIAPGDRGRPLTEISGRLDHPTLAADVAEALSSHRLVERNLTSRDGERHYFARLRPYASGGAEPGGVVATFVDVTSLIEAESHRKVLIAELNHRVKNMLAIAIALTRQTAKGAASVGAFGDSLVARLESMARAYELLSRENWSAVEVGDLIGQEMAPFGAGRIELDGPDVRVTPKQGLSLAMILHELVTNAARYGALTLPSGRVSVAWTVAGTLGGERLRLRWREIGGPPVEAPAAGGFGLRLVDRETAHGLSGTATVAWPPEGLAVDLDIPIGART